MRAALVLLALALAPAGAKAQLPDLSPVLPPGFAEASLRRQELFVQPFALSSPLGQVAARLVVMGGAGPAGVDLDQIAVLSAWVLELYAPVLTLRASDTRSVQRFRVNVKLPWTFAPAHQFAVIFGLDLPGPAGLSTVFAYAYGSEAWSAQARAGLGHDRIVGAPEDVLRPIVWIDASGAYRLGRHFSLVLDAEYKHNLARPGHALRFWPGLRFFPFGNASLSVGAGALVWIEGTPPGPEELRRLGAVVEVGQHWM